MRLKTSKNIEVYGRTPLFVLGRTLTTLVHGTRFRSRHNSNGNREHCRTLRLRVEMILRTDARVEDQP